MPALQEQPSPLCFTEYNGYMFGTKTKSRLRCIPVMDNSKRTEIYRKYVLSIHTYITPRRNIPGDGTNLNIQANKPGAEIPVPGINPYNIAATTDPEIKLILDKLTETGKTLRYIGHGSGDIVVNTVHPETGKFVQDLDFGPHCRIVSLSPSGFQKCWKMEWECEFNIQTGESFKHGIDNIGKKILEYNYTTEYRYDEHGYCTRTIQGHLKIVPPMYRHSNQLPPSGTSAPEEREDAVSNFIEKFKTASEYASLEGAESKADNIEKISYYLTSILKYVKEKPFLLSYEAGWDLSDIEKIIDHIAEEITGEGDFEGFSDITSNKDNIVTNFYTFLTTYQQLTTGLSLEIDTEPYTNIIKQKEDETNNVYFLRNYLISGLAVRLPFLRKIPELMKVFPESDGPLNNKICYGPFATDNTGNIQNYETADQYRELVYNAFIIPFNFRRVCNFRIDSTASILSFSITDKEQPSFSFVPGYSHVNAHQDTSLSGPAFKQGQTSISASFKLGKFINIKKAIRDTSGYADAYKEDAEYDEKKFKRAVPSKRQAYVDFLKLVLQRLALPLFAFDKNSRFSIKDTETGQIKRITFTEDLSCIPKSFQCREDILSDSISFTLSYSIISELKNFFVTTGHGLPAIIASDLKTNTKLISDVIGLEENKVKKVQYCSAILFSDYTDFLTHKDWLISQRYSSNNARGCSELIYDRTYNRPINLNLLDTNIHRNIPLHGEYPVKKGVSRNLKKFDPSEVGSNVVSSADKVVICTLYVYNIFGKVDRIEQKIHSINKPDGFNTFSIVNPDALSSAQLKLVQRELTVAEIDDIVNGKKPTESLIIRIAGLHYTPYNITYRLYTQEGYKKLDPSLSILNSDLDEFEKFLNEEYPELSTDKVSLTIPEVKYTNSGAFDDITAYDSSADFITSVVPDFIANPTPRNSWVEYHCEIEVVTDNKTIRHKILPTSPIISDFDGNEPNLPPLRNNDIRNNADALFNTGPNSLKGGSPASDLELPSGQNTDIIQTVNEPAIKVILKGYAERLKWEVVAPTLLRYGGRSVIQKKRRFNYYKKGTGDTVTYYGAWYIEYDVIGQPSGFLGQIDSPYTMDNLDIPINDNKTEDTILLDEQYSLLDTLKGYMTSQ